MPQLLRYFLNFLFINLFTLICILLFAQTSAAQDIKVRLGENQTDEGTVGYTNPMPVTGAVGSTFDVEIVAPLPLDVEVTNSAPIDVNVVSGGSGSNNQLGPVVEIGFATLNATYATYASVVALGYTDETYLFAWNNTDVPFKVSYDGGTTDHAIVPPFFWGTFPIDADAADVEIEVVGTATEGEIYLQVGK